MPIETPSGVLEVENAKLRASSIEATIAVGIGTESNDAYPLQVFKETEPDIRIQEGSTISSASRIYSNNSNLYIQTGSDFTSGSSGDIAFQTMQGASTHMVIKSDGKVGVGTASPGVDLHVNGDTILDGSTYRKRRDWNRNALAYVYLGNVRTNATTGIRLDVNLNATNSGYQMQQFQIILQGSDNSHEGGQLVYSVQGTRNISILRAVDIGYVYVGSGGSYEYQLWLKDPTTDVAGGMNAYLNCQGYYNFDTGVSDVAQGGAAPTNFQEGVVGVLVDTSGNVGIGTTSPRATLDVNSTDSIIIPVGTDAERNATPVNGMLRLNTTLNTVEYYYNNWTRLSPLQIVTNGLVVHLDAADYNSYPTSGSTWYDLSGNGRDGTLQGSVSWQNNGFASYFDFPGANADYIKQTAGTQIIYKDICIVFNVDAMNNAFAYLISKSTTADDSLRMVNNNINNPGNTGDWAPSSITYYVNGVADTGDVSITNGEWYIVGGENTNTNLLSSAWNYYLGTGYTQGTRNLNGKIAFVALYDRVLTATEQIQNYNALRGRFGL